MKRTMTARKKLMRAPRYGFINLAIPRSQAIGCLLALEGHKGKQPAGLKRIQTGLARALW